MTASVNAQTLDKISYLISKNGLHIIQNDTFNLMMKSTPASGIKSLVADLTTAFEIKHQRVFKVRPTSMLIEIWGHYYAAVFLKRWSRFFDFLGLKKIKNKLLHSAILIDIAEKPIDKNRWLWDILAYLLPLFQIFIRDKKQKTTGIKKQ